MTWSSRCLGLTTGTLIRATRCRSAYVCVCVYKHSLQQTWDNITRDNHMIFTCQRSSSSSSFFTPSFSVCFCVCMDQCLRLLTGLHPARLSHGITTVLSSLVCGPVNPKSNIVVSFLPSGSCFCSGLRCPPFFLYFLPPADCWLLAAMYGRLLVFSPVYALTRP